MIGTREAAELLGKSPDVVRRLLKDEQLEGRPLYPNRRRKTWVTTLEAIERFKAGLTARPTHAGRVIIPATPDELAKW